MGSDLDMPLFRTYQVYFQFTLPAWRAIYFQFIAHYCHHISILAPCLGSDKSAMLHRRSFAVFNSRSPHEERQKDAIQTAVGAIFNSRSPHGERLYQYVLVKLHFIFQFTLSVWGAILICLYFVLIKCIFNSRSPHGER